MLARFINVHGDQNLGLLLEQDPSGLILVFWDDFAQLRNRLKASQRYKAVDEKPLRPHIGWCRPAAADEKRGTHLEPLPANLPWTLPVLHRLAQAILTGKLAEVWANMKEDVTAEYGKHFHDEPA
jgi:hypothetical protein